MMFEALGLMEMVVVTWTTMMHCWLAGVECLYVIKELI